MILRKIYLLLLSISSFAFAQEPSWQWAHGIGAPIKDPFVGLGYETFGSSVATDAEGNVYVAGIFSDSIVLDGFAVYATENTDFPEQVDVFVAKYDAQGKLLWLKQFGSFLQDEVHGATVDADNNVYICGQYAGSLLTGGDTLIPIPPVKNNGFNGYIVRCSPDGNFDWAVTSHTENHQTTVLGISAVGRMMVIAGKTSKPGGLLRLGNKEIPNAGAFVAKIHSDGIVDWAYPIEDENNQRMGVSALPSGESYVAYKDQIVKYDSQGNLIKTLTVNGGTFTAIASHKAAMCGVGVFTDSITVGTITFTQRNLGMFAATYAHDTELKNVRIGVSAQSEAHGICADSMGGFYTTGTFVRTIRFDEQTVVADSDFSSYVVRFGPDYRTTLLAAAHKDGASCLLGSIATTSANEAVVSGSFYQRVEFPPHLITSAVWYPDIVVAKLQQPPAAVEQQETHSNLSLYPSPATNILNVSYVLTTSSRTTITLFDLLGREVAHISEETVPEGIHNACMDVTSMRNGIYCLVLQSEGKTESKIIHIVK